VRSRILRKLRVKLDLRRIVAQLSREDQRRMTEEEVLEWLRDAGFVRESATHWIVAEADLGQVQPSEVLECEPVNE